MSALSSYEPPRLLYHPSLLLCATAQTPEWRYACAELTEAQIPSTADADRRRGERREGRGYMGTSCFRSAGVGRSTNQACSGKRRQWSGPDSPVPDAVFALSLSLFPPPPPPLSPVSPMSCYGKNVSAPGAFSLPITPGLDFCARRCLPFE